MSNVQSLLEELKSHPEADGLMRECGTSDYAAAALSVAKQLGIETDANAGEIRAFVEEAEASRRASTDQVIEEMAELDDSDLAWVAGGEDGVPFCENNHWDDFFVCLDNYSCMRLWYCPELLF
jgi:folate-dependent phosphoribosylglycinamide formyltransferase PurN